MLTATAESILAPGSHQICVKDQGKNKKKAAEGSNCKKKKSPPAQPRAGCDYRQYLLYFSRGSDISFPRQTHDGCHALWLHWVCDDVISEKESKIGFSLRSFSCFGVFQTLPSFPFFFLQNSPRDVSKPNLSPRAFPSPLLPLSRAGAGRWILTGKWVGHTVYCQPQRPLWPPRESPWRVSFSAPPPEMSEKNKTHCVTAVRHFLILFIL